MPDYKKPLDAIIALKTQLSTQITALKQKSSSPEEHQETAFTILRATIQELNKIYQIFSILLALPESDLKEKSIKNVIQNMQLKRKLTLDGNEILKTLTNSHLPEFRDFYDEPYCWELCYYTATLCIQDNQTYPVKSRFNTIETEIYTLLIQHVITPQIDPVFKKIKNNFYINPTTTQFGIRFEKTDYDEYYQYLALEKKAAQVTERYDIYKESHSDIFKDFSEEIFPILDKLDVYNYLINVTIKAYYKEFTDTTQFSVIFTESFSLLKNVFQFFANVSVLNQELDALIKKYDSLFNYGSHSNSNPNQSSNAISKRQAKKNRTLQRVVRNAPSLETEIFLNKGKAATEEMPIVTPSADIDSLPVSHEVTPITDTSFEKLSEKLAEKLEEVSVEENTAESAALTYDYMLYPKKKKSISQTANETPETEVATPHFGSKTEKTLQKIIDLSPKLKYSALTRFFVNKLSGYVNDKTGSSSRKLFADKHGVFLHERHGRDRKQYVDVNVVKDTRDLLQNLKIIPVEAAKKTMQPRK